MSATYMKSELAVRYVRIALGSQTNGDRMLGQTPRAKSHGMIHGIGKAALQGRPSCTKGAERSAAIREKTVSTSAARVTGRRHSAWVRRSIAEIMIPAWLMPIQKTKLTRYTPHITGRFSPVTPKPWFSR